ncbi:MAG: phage Gp37/Gp68 family protein [Candidatus Acidiferrales bacterium]
MGDKTKIEWTAATWNPVTGCTKVSAGCKHCYAERDFHRPYPGREFTDVRTHPDRLTQPLRWKRPRKIFVNSMSDLFHESVPEKFIGKIFAMMSKCPQHIFQVLTKRPAKMLALIRDDEDCWGPFQEVMFRDSKAEDWPLPNVWLGVSVEDQPTADARIPLLLQTPAAVRFVSYEPALGPVDFAKYLGLPCDHWEEKKPEMGFLVPHLDWVIAGGESGPKARSSHPDWFRTVRDQCQTAGVPFFFKQWGEWGPRTELTKNAETLHVSGALADGGKTPIFRWGKKRAGRLLDGREWKEFPKLKTDH